MKKEKYTVVIFYGCNRVIEKYNSKKQAMRRFAGWYAHGLDMCGQVSSECYVFEGENCIMSDRY